MARHPDPTGFLAGGSSPVSPGALLETVRSLHAQLHHQQSELENIDLASRLERDVGLDSLARVELLRRIEVRFGVRLPETALISVETVGDLLHIASSVAAAPQPGSATPRRFSRAVVPSAARIGTPLRAATLTEVLDWRVARQPDATHVIVLDADKSVSQSYAELRSGARRVAAALARAEVRAGSTVALMLPTGVGYLHAFFGTLLAGATPVPIYPPTRASQLEEHVKRHTGILTNAGVAALLSTAEVRSVARLLQAHVPSLEQVIAVDDLGPPTGFWSSPPPPDPDSIAMLQYTSGSTGNPKGVILTHAQLLANIRAIGRAIQPSASDIFVSWLPLYHDMGLIGAWLGSLYYGCLFVLMPPTAFLTRPARWLRAIHDYRATLSASPNFGYELCAQRASEEELEGIDLRSWRIAFNGAEPVHPETLERFARRFARYGFAAQAMTPVYGLAEAAVGLTFPPLARGPRIDRIHREELSAGGRAVPARDGETDALGFVSCGLPLPGYRVRIAADDGTEAPERTEGLVQFAGPSATTGYYRNPSATARLRRGDWLDTGDRGYMAEGELYITGREKDIIIRRGRHIYPEELERAVGALSGVRKGCVAVFGAQAAAGGTERLVVVAETALTEPGTRTALATRINQCVIDTIGEPAQEVVLAPAHAVLKTSSGKLRRAATRAAYEAGTLVQTRAGIATQVLRLTAAALLPATRRLLRRACRIAYGLYAWFMVLIVAVSAGLGVLLTRAPQTAWKLMHVAAQVAIGVLAIPFDSASDAGNEPVGPHVVVVNHCSYVDSVFVGALLSGPHRFVAKRELASVPLLGPWLRKLGTLFIERSSPRESVNELARLRQALEAGVSVVVFPEGTFTETTGLRPFHLGAFQLAAAAKVPIVPVALRGTRSVLRSGQWLLRRAPVRAVRGSPIEPSVQDGEFSAAVRLRDAAHEFILSHCGEPDLS